VVADQAGGLEPVLGDELRRLGAGVVELEGADDLRRDRPRQRGAGDAGTGRGEDGEQQRRDEDDEPDPLDRRLAVIAPREGCAIGTRSRR
jgi:hypothetical protein